MTGPRLVLALAGALLAMPAPAALAQDYPSRPVKIIVPFGAGGPADVTARQIGGHFAGNASASPLWSKTAPAPAA